MLDATTLSKKTLILVTSRLLARISIGFHLKLDQEMLLRNPES